MKKIELDYSPMLEDGLYPREVRGNFVTGMQFAYYHKDGVGMYYLDEDTVEDIWSRYDSVCVAHEYLEKKLKKLETELFNCEDANTALGEDKRKAFERLAEKGDRIRHLEEQIEEIKAKPLDPNDLVTLKAQYEVAEIIQLRKEGII